MVFRGRGVLADSTKDEGARIRKLGSNFRKGCSVCESSIWRYQSGCEISQEPKNYKVVTFDKLNFKEHIDEWVAIAAACDGIISVSTALVHFAGAIGQKVAVVMPGEQGPWHLGLKDTESMAYKNVRIYRPTKEESLPVLIDRVSKLIV